MSLSRGDVVLITFPFSDLTASKVRPAIVLSGDKYNQRNEDLIVCLITSNIARKGLYLIKMDSSHPDFRSAGFKVPSAIIADKIHTLHQSLIKRKLGTVGRQTVSEIQSILKDIILN